MGTRIKDITTTTTTLTSKWIELDSAAGGSEKFDAGSLMFKGADIVGLNWNSTTNVYTRLGAAAGRTRSFFDNISPFVNIRRCNMNDAGLVTAYYGDTAYSETGSNGQVMVEIPKFWYKTDILSTGYNWWISSVEQSGFKVFPCFIRNGVEKNYQYLGAYEASVYDVTVSAIEVNTITITAEPTSAGNLTITLDGDYAFTVAVVDADTIEGVVDKIVAAGDKTDYMGVIWAVTKVDASNVRYTANTAGLKSTVTMPTACGVTSTIVKTTSGAGGYVLNDSTGYDFTATTGDKLCSIAGVKPYSGWKNATATIINARVLAKNRASIFDQQDFLITSALQYLMLVEYGSFNLQSLLSVGVTNITDDGATNMSVKTGLTTALGNSSGEVSYTHYKTAQITKPFSYRGVENFYGNIYKFVDGINIKADRNPWIADNGFVSDQFSSPYIDSGLTLCTTDGWAININVNSSKDFMFLASIVGGSSSTGLTDYYYQATGNKIACFGGSWINGSAAGGFHWRLSYASGDVSRIVGGRLFCK